MSSLVLEVQMLSTEGKTKAANYMPENYNIRVLLSFMKLLVLKVL